MNGYLVLDLATCPIDEAEALLAEEPITAPANYRDEVKIAEYVAGKRAERLERAALDPDLCRISALGIGTAAATYVLICRTDDEERHAIAHLAPVFALLEADQPRLIGFNALKFDWPVLMRRARYLDVPLSPINVDRYRGPHVDLYDRLSHHGTVPAHSLTWYARRLGWTDLVKPLTGAEEARAPAEGRWTELEASVRHDLEATIRLARWLGVLPVEGPA